MGILILLRHGASVWNEKNLFTGWVDIPLSPKGIQESLQAGKLIATLPIDCIFTSTLIRAQMTAMLAMSSHSKTPFIVSSDQGDFESWATVHNPQILGELVPVRCAWQLNERMYGALQGMNKEAMCQKFGADQVQRWRRSFEEVPPGGESLKMTSERTLPYFKEEIFPFLKKGKNVLIAAHGNSLRSIVMMLEELLPEKVIELEIPTGEPWIYRQANGKWRRDD